MFLGFSAQNLIDTYGEKDSIGRPISYGEIAGIPNMFGKPFYDWMVSTGRVNWCHFSEDKAECCDQLYQLAQKFYCAGSNADRDKKTLPVEMSTGRMLFNMVEDFLSHLF